MTSLQLFLDMGPQCWQSDHWLQESHRRRDVCTISSKRIPLGKRKFWQDNKVLGPWEICACVWNCPWSEWNSMHSISSRGRSTLQWSTGLTQGERGGREEEGREEGKEGGDEEKEEGKRRGGIASVLWERLRWGDRREERGGTERGKVQRCVPIIYLHFICCVPSGVWLGAGSDSWQPTNPLGQSGRHGNLRRTTGTLSRCQHGL